MVELHEDCPFISSEDIAAEGHTMGSLAVLSHLVELYHVIETCNHLVHINNAAQSCSDHISAHSDWPNENLALKVSGFCKLC